MGGRVLGAKSGTRDNEGETPKTDRRLLRGFSECGVSMGIKKVREVTWKGRSVLSRDGRVGQGNGSGGKGKERVGLIPGM